MSGFGEHRRAGLINLGVLDWGWRSPWAIVQNHGGEITLASQSGVSSCFTELVQFRNQFTIAKNLDFPGIVKPLSLENYRNGYALVMEDFGGISLKDYATNVERLHAASLQQFLHIAIQIVTMLDELMRQCVIHKD